MKIITRLLLILLGLLGLGAAFLCGRYAFLNVTSADGFFDVLKQLFSLDNLFITLLAIFCLVVGVKDLLRGIIKGKSLFVFITGLLFAAATVFAVIKANEQSLLQNMDVLGIIFAIGGLAFLSMVVGVLTIIVKARD